MDGFGKRGSDSVTASAAPRTDAPVVLVTGGGRRTGAAIVRRLHREGWRTAIHYRASSSDAHALAAALNAERPGSAIAVAGDLLDLSALPRIIDATLAAFGRLDALVNNASAFYATPLAGITAADWSLLVGSNLQAPLFLAQAAAPALLEAQGSIVNITDIHAERPMAGYLLYSVAKAGLRGLTHALARELAPGVRVNAVAPGPIEWPTDGQITADERERILAHVPLRREGGSGQVAEAVKYLICDASYVTGHTINVDGGRSIAL